MASDLEHEGTGIEGVFKRFADAAGKFPQLQLVADTLLKNATGGALADKNAIAVALQRLVAEKKLLPKADGQFDAAAAESAISSVLAALGMPKLALADRISTGAMKLINNSFDRCGANTVSDPPAGPDIGFKDGKRVIVYFVEEDPSGTPLLPRVEGSRKRARNLVKLGFEHWENVLDVEIVRSEKRDQSNLVVTGETFGRDVPDLVLALTDIGPPNRKQLRLVFDLAEEGLTSNQFMACAAHELGHALGIFHADVPNSGSLMSPFLSEIFQPTVSDRNAAVQHGWQLIV